MYISWNLKLPGYFRAWLVIFWIVIHIFAFTTVTQPANAQIDEIAWTSPVNISNSEDKVSTDPFLLADPSGVVHLFWAEKVTDDPGLLADTILYSVWDGQTWSVPIDIAFSPPSDGTPIVSYPQAVLDDRGWIHLAWLSEPNFPYYSLNYMSAPAWLADHPQAWTQKTVLASNLTGTKYSFDIDYNPTQGIHIIYATGASGENLKQEKAVAYIRSMDNGATWSEPTLLNTYSDLDRGASDTRILLVEPDKVFASWTTWDETGNGQEILFTRSLDNGTTWDAPKPLTERIGDEYERDWNNLTQLDNGQLLSFWEGGYRAYHYMSISKDDGVTWSEPVDAFPWLIGEAGYSEFVRDSNGVIHVFLSKRIREGNLDRGEQGGMWHSVWEGGRWREPNLATMMGGAENMTNPKVAIINGNRIVAAWYGSHIDEIMVQTGVISNAPEIPSIPWDVESPTKTDTSTPIVMESVQEPSVTQSPASVKPALNEVQQSSIGMNQFIILSVIPALLITTLIVVYKMTRRRSD